MANRQGRPAPYVFLSYARKDNATANTVRREMIRAGIQPWQDSQAIRPAQPWAPAIDRALQECRAVLALISEASSQSPYVTYEWSFALGAGKPVFPVILDKSSMRRLHHRLRGIQWIDFSGRKSWIRLWEALGATEPAPGATPSRATLRAALHFEGGKPSQVDDAYEFSLWIENPPPGATHVIYELHDDTFDEPRWTVKKPSSGFLSDDQNSYGDVLITAEVKSGKRTIQVLKTTLLKALSREHGSDKRARRALKHIREN